MGERKTAQGKKKLSDSLPPEALSWCRGEGVLREHGLRGGVGSGITACSEERDNI